MEQWKTAGVSLFSNARSWALPGGSLASVLNQSRLQAATMSSHLPKVADTSTNGIGHGSLLRASEPGKFLRFFLEMHKWKVSAKVVTIAE